MRASVLPFQRPTASWDCVVAIDIRLPEMTIPSVFQNAIAGTGEPSPQVTTLSLIVQLRRSRPL